MNRNMNVHSEWGVPDWHEAAEYRTRPARSGRQWAWEFLRRNHSYRAFWREKIEPYHREGWIERNSEGEIWPYLGELRNSFGVELPSPPASSTPCSFVSDGMRYVDNTNAFPQDDWLSYDGKKIVRLALRESEVAFVVDLARPLRKQLEALSRVAVQRQERHQSAVKLPRKSVHLVTYLRLLDARDANASRRLIEEVLFSQLDNEYPDRKRSKAFDNFERAAQRLRDGGYRELAAT